uniref:Rho guanine nucleotide exchange factor 28 n=1 Tax=Cynoglossus semilaevis TaxID=244447 RepID=A0A3P8W4C4_CYNSE
MELNRRRVPVYGQVQANVKLKTTVPHDADFYIVVQGSMLAHVTAAERQEVEDGLTLSFMVPGNDCMEVSSVTAYIYTEDQAKPCGSEASLEYVTDVVQEAAEYLSAHRDRLGPQSYQEVLKRFPLLGQAADKGLSAGDLHCDEDDENDARAKEGDLRHLDEQITQALANMDYLRQWKSQQGEAAHIQYQEKLLQLAVRLGLPGLSGYLSQRSRDQKTETVANEERETPHQLTQTNQWNHFFRGLTSSPDPALAPGPGVCRRVWSDNCSLLRFCPWTNSITLTVRQAPGSCQQDTIKTLRDRLKDPSTFDLINMVRENTRLQMKNKEEFLCNGKGLSKEPQMQDIMVDDDFKDGLVLSLHEDDDEKKNSLPVYDHILKESSEEESHVVRPLYDTQCMVASDSQRTALQPQADVGVPYSIRGVTRDSTATDSGVWDALDTNDLLLVIDTPTHSSKFSSVTSSPRCSPADQALARLTRPTSLESTSERDSSPVETCDLSPSLVALEVDSEEDMAETNVLPPPRSSDVEKRAEKVKVASRQLPDLTCTRSKSASSAFDPATKDLDDQGVRLRSYSYSSPKISFRPTRFARDSQTSDMNPEQRGCSLQEQSHEKRIEEEELDNYSVPTKVESEKYRVIRTFSFLKNRMSSTRSKSKGKGKDRDKQTNGHRFATGSCLGPTVCIVCDKPASGKDMLHCPNCTAIVHKACKESVPPCLKKLQDKSAAVTRTKTASLPQNFTVRESSPQSLIPVSASSLMSSSKDRKDTTTHSCPISGSDSRLSESSETEWDWVKVNGLSDELLPTPVSSVSADSSFGEDCVDSCIQADILMDAGDYQAESWSLTVEQKFCKKQDKRVIKRQDVIYELMQTELHHLQTLHIMAEVFRRGMMEKVQLDMEAVQRVFPCLDQLLLIHHGFFSAMKERQHGSTQQDGSRNYLIGQIGDILLHQFSGETGETMKEVYGEFCSRHIGAVGFFKELQQQNKRFQNFIKQQGNNSLHRRRGIPECILLVTQRITKYPVLLERILQYTQENTEECADLSKALARIKEVVAAVDLKVSVYERHQKLQDVWSRMENRSSAKLKNGHTFRKQDMMGSGQTLKHQGVLLWKTATGRLKDVLALLLTDTLIFLQEKDQKYTFAAVDQKAPVVALQKLIVREVANEERGMFLISASAAGPEMYEVHAASKEERNTWMRLIREAVESCPEEEEEYTSESEEERRAAEARVQKIQKLQESLMSQDQQICSSLEEKLRIYTELSMVNGRSESSMLEPRLLSHHHPEEVPQGTTLLSAALKEAEKLKATLSWKTCSPSSQSSSPVFDTDPVVGPAPPVEIPSHAVESAPETPEVTEGRHTPVDDNDKIAQSVHSLTQLLYSLQAVVTIQDSYYELQRLRLQESGRRSPRVPGPHPASTRSNTLQEQEKQRNLEKQKEDVVAIQRLQQRLRQERGRWERECQAKESQQEEQESKLEERERQCHLEAQRLRQEREELDLQQEEYQLSLERLKDGQRRVEMERECLEKQQKLVQTLKNGRQRKLPTVIPHMVIPLHGQQDPAPSHSRGHAGNGSMFVNEAAFSSTSINNRHVNHKRNDPSAHNCLNTLLARSNSRNSPKAKARHDPQSDPQSSGGRQTGYLYSTTGRLGPQHAPPGYNSRSYIGETWLSTASAADLYPEVPHPTDPQLDLSALVSLETDSSGEEGREETIVYL